jgi:hypothetical protein
MTITIGTWAIPLVISITCFLAVFLTKPKTMGGYLDPMFAALQVLASLAGATIISLIAWLVWALL